MLYDNLTWALEKRQRSKRDAGLDNVGLLAGYNASTRGVFWSSTTKEPSFSSATRALSLPGNTNCCRHGATGIRFSKHPRAYCPLGSETLKNSSFETEGERMMAWVDRNVYMERLWALEGAQSRLFIDEAQLRKGFERTINRIRARGG